MMPRAFVRAGFSLVEMLLAVFILGIGVISIATLFPAGIALQRQASDDTIGPLVAQNAFATIRSKLSQEDFGRFEDFGLPKYSTTPVGGAAIPQVSGDWGWMRPGFLFDNPNTAQDEGAIDIFSAALSRQRFGVTPVPSFTVPPATELVEYYGGGSALYGIPYNLSKYPLFSIASSNPSAVPTNLIDQRLIEPAITFTQAERAYPQGPANYGQASTGTLNAQYYWDCMFRRNGGRVQVAVFVYRVGAAGGDTRAYTASPNDPNNSNGAAFVAVPFQSPIPARYTAPNFGTATSWPNRTAATAAPDEIPGTGTGQPFGNEKTWDDWQLPGAWWIDNHGTTHKVLVGRTNNSQGPVKLQRPIPVLPRSPVNGYAPTASGAGPNAWIGAVWFVPARDSRGNILTPIYASVEEL
ncbi:MAG: prepilin-type N-terminal cleavage/methylation domain-containing protein [Planctomycetota bacterium]